MSIIIIAFQGAPKVSDESIQKDQELEKTLKEKVNGTRVYQRHLFVIIACYLVTNFISFAAAMVVGHEDEIDLPTVFQQLLDEDIEGLPPGGGLYAK